MKFVTLPPEYVYMNLLPENKITILDGATGTMIQRYSLAEEDYNIGKVLPESFKPSAQLKGNNECLNLTRADIIEAIHREYIRCGADIIETNTFSANRISQSEYGCEDIAAQMAYEGALIARRAADAEKGRKIRRFEKKRRKSFKLFCVLPRIFQAPAQTGLRKKYLRGIEFL